MVVNVDEDSIKSVAVTGYTIMILMMVVIYIKRKVTRWIYVSESQL